MPGLTLHPLQSPAAAFSWANCAGSFGQESGHVFCKGQPPRYRAGRREEPEGEMEKSQQSLIARTLRERPSHTHSPFLKPPTSPYPQLVTCVKINKGKPH